ncbi:MAG: exodeoxyribonuclease VII large subunit [Acutalibacteraceae bacterium]
MSVGEPKTLTVTQLNMYVKSLLESSAYLNNITLVGEISNFTNHYKSGHFYLSLKDETGVVRAVMFNRYSQKIDFKPEDGMKVICTGKVSLYERDGLYQFYITSMQQQGVGDLSIRFEKLKKKLRDEGLFDREKKRQIPKYPRAIALITSPDGAAVQDMKNILARRFPVVKVIICPVLVQGDGAAPQIIDAIKRVNAAKCADTIIIGRGGGSIEDLWAFNDEALAYAIRESEIPIISGVGHETDFTICDFAADLRAPTPSGAAELAVPEKVKLTVELNNVKRLLNQMLNNQYEQKRLKLSALMNKTCLSNPGSMLDSRRQAVDSLQMRNNSAITALLNRKKHQFTAAAAKVGALSPMNILKRGYSAVFKDDKATVSVAELKSGDDIKVRFSDGEVAAVVK